MITELSQDLINKIITVPALQQRVGAAVGGTKSDPTMAQAPLPYAWVVFGGSQPISDGDGGQRYRREVYNFAVIVGISYGGTEEDLLETQLPVLEAIAQAAHGQESFKFADLWEYTGADLKSVQTDRLIYQLGFSIIGHHAT